MKIKQTPLILALVSLAILTLGPQRALAAPYTLNISGTFNGSFIPDPVQNSLADLLGTTFNGSFTTDSDPDSVDTAKAVLPGEIGWYLPDYTLTVAGGIGYPTFGISPATGDNLFYSAAETMGLLADGYYDYFSVSGHAPGITFGAYGTPLTSASDALATGIMYDVTLIGSPDMLSDPAHPGPSTIDLSELQFVLLDVVELVEGNEIGSAYIFGRLSSGGTLANLTITPVPEAETYAMMLAGLGLVGFAARRRKCLDTA